MPFTFQETVIDDVVRVISESFRDERGRLAETYDRSAFHDAGIENDFMLELVSESAENVLRGLHFQTEPYQQAKLVRCVSGTVYDVAVDIRRRSETFGEHVVVRLSSEDDTALYIPRGFAHGFLALTDNTVVTYKLDNEYSPKHESGVHWQDPTLNIDWPLETDPIVDSSDASLPTLADNSHLPTPTGGHE